MVALRQQSWRFFSEQDFHRASMREVAKKAGVSFSSIYEHFGSKEKLLFACVDNWLKVLVERMVDHLQGIEDLKEKLRKVFWLQLDYYEKKSSCGEDSVFDRALSKMAF